MLTFDQFCDDLRVSDEEREALVHHLAGMRYRETLTLVDGPIARVAKANASKRQASKIAVANDPERAGGAPAFVGPRLS